jgi:uncharacterized protein with FMN-binding domain
MSELRKRATPGLAVAGAALATVWMFDPALHPDPMSATSASGDGSAADPTTPQAEPVATDCSNPETATGDAAPTPWGPVQVRMQVATDGTVCAVQAVVYPQNDRKSAQINASAIPSLDARAAEQGLEFDAFSGATYTSEAYRQSMQSILDQR